MQVGELWDGHGRKQVYHGVDEGATKDDAE